MPSILITGANRGLGLEFARQYAADGWRVIATCRNPGQARDLGGLEGRVEILALDVTDKHSVGALVDALGTSPIDVLLLNAGVHLQKDCSLEELDGERWQLEFHVNVIAPLMLARRLADHVARSDLRRIVAISSGSGSIQNMKTGGNHAYRSGKAALNASMKILAGDLASRGVTVVPIAPGHTRTDMGGSNAPYTAEDSVTRVRGAISRLTFNDSGAFLSRDGIPLPWYKHTSDPARSRGLRQQGLPAVAPNSWKKHERHTRHLPDHHSRPGPCFVCKSSLACAKLSGETHTARGRHLPRRHHRFSCALLGRRCFRVARAADHRREPARGDRQPRL